MKAGGGWSNWMLSYGLKPHEQGDIAEAKAILESFVAADEGAKQK